MEGLPGLGLKLRVKVLIDLRMVRGPLHGIARYALELARRIPKIAPDLHFLGLVGPKFPQEGLGDLAPTIPLVRCAADFLAVGEQPAMTHALLRAKPDLFHATSFSMPLFWPGCLVATLHDANHLALTDQASIAKALYYRFVVVPRARTARGLITVSEFSRRELATYLDLDRERLQVISNGVDESFGPPPASEVDGFRQRRGLPRRYFAAIGSTKPHKNLRVLQAIAERLPAPLVLLAGLGARKALGFSDKVIDLSPLPDRELVRFYAGAIALLIPSRYEGFGLPALEGMACGTPVIASRAGALPEVVGKAGILVAPDNALAWLEATQRISRDAPQRAHLRNLGLERVRTFAWDDCAQRTLTVYRRALERGA